MRAAASAGAAGSAASSAAASFVAAAAVPFAAAAAPCSSEPACSICDPPAMLDSDAVDRRCPRLCELHEREWGSARCRMCFQCTRTELQPHPSEPVSHLLSGVGARRVVCESCINRYLLGLSSALTHKLTACSFCGQSDQDVYDCSRGSERCRCGGRLCQTCLTANFGGEATEHAAQVHDSQQGDDWMCPACDDGEDEGQNDDLFAAAAAAAGSAAAASSSSAAAALASSAASAVPRFPLLAHPALSDVLSSAGSPRAWQCLNPFELREPVKGMTYHTPLHPCAAALAAAATAGEFASPSWGSYQSAASCAQPAVTLNHPIDHEAFAHLDQQYAKAMQDRTVLSLQRDAAAAAPIAAAASASAASSNSSSSSAASASSASASPSPSPSPGLLRIVSSSFFRCANFLWRHEPTQAERQAEQQARSQQRAALRDMSLQLAEWRIRGTLSSEDQEVLEREHQQNLDEDKAQDAARRSRAQLLKREGLDERNPHLLYVYGITKFAESFPTIFPAHERWRWRIYYDQSLFLRCGCEKCTRQRSEAGPGHATEQYRIDEAWRLLFDHLRTLPFVQLVYFNQPAYQLRFAEVDFHTGALTRDLRGFHLSNFGMLVRFLALADLGHTAELVLLSDIDGVWSDGWKAKLDRMLERKAVCLRACDPAYRVELWGGASAFAWHPPAPGLPASQYRPLCFDSIESSLHAFASWHMRCTDKMRHLRGVGMHFLQHQRQEDRRGIVALMREELNAHASDTGYEETWSNRQVKRVYNQLAPDAAAEKPAAAAPASASSSSQAPKRNGGWKQSKKKPGAAAAAGAAPSTADGALDDDDDDDDDDDPSSTDDSSLDEFKGYFAYGADQLFLSAAVWPIVRASVGSRESRCESPQPGSLVNVFVRLPEDALERLPPPPSTPMVLASDPPARNTRQEIGKLLKPIKPIPKELTEERVVQFVTQWIEEQQNPAAGKIKAGATAGTKRKASVCVVKKPAPRPSRLQPQRYSKRRSSASPSSDGAAAAAAASPSAAAASASPLWDGDFGDVDEPPNGFGFVDEDDRSNSSDDAEEEEQEKQPLLDDSSDGEWSTREAKKKQRIDRPASALSGSSSLSPHSPLTAPSAAAARPAADALLKATDATLQVLRLWYPSVGASGARKIRLLRVLPADTLYAYAADLAEVVAQRKYSSELIRGFHSPSEKLRLQVEFAAPYNVLPAAGVRRFLSISKMQRQDAYRQWITKVLLPKMNSVEMAASDGPQQARSSQLIDTSHDAVSASAPAATPRRSHDEEKSRINPHPQPLSPIPDWIATEMEESQQQQQQQQQHIWEQSAAQSHSPRRMPVFPSSAVAVAARAHAVQADPVPAHNTPTPMQLDDEELVDLTQSHEPAYSVLAPATPSSAASSTAAAAAAAAAPVSPLCSPATTVLSRFTSHSPVPSPMIDIARARMSDGEAGDASSNMPPLSCPSTAAESAAASSAATSSTQMGSRVVSFDLTPASVSSSASSASSLAPAAANRSSPAVSLTLDADDGDWDPRKPPPILPAMKEPFAGDSTLVFSAHSVTASASLHFDAAPALPMKLELVGSADFDDEMGDVDESPMPAAAAAAKSGAREVIELDDDEEEETAMTQPSLTVADHPVAAAAAAAASPARTPSRSSAGPSSAACSAPARAASSSGALSSRKSSSSSSGTPATRWQTLQSDQFVPGLLEWAPHVVAFVTENQPVKWKSGRHPKLFTFSAVKLQKLFTDINEHQQCQGDSAVFTDEDIPTFARTLWMRLHQPQ